MDQKHVYNIIIKFDGDAYRELIEDGSLDAHLLDSYLKSDAEYAIRCANFAPMAAAVIAGDNCVIVLDAFDNHDDDPSAPANAEAEEVSA